VAAVDNIGKFQVLAPLGQGAHSSILHVRRQADSKQYALKVVPLDGPDDQKFLEQARHEFKVAQKLDHANLIKIYALEEVKDWLFRVKKAHLLIEFVNGKTLDTAPPLSMPKLVSVFKQVAAGLEHMHRRNVLHADMKPANVMFSRSGEVKIIDYGLAWIKGDDKSRLQGTPEYMAPETAKRKLVNERTDIFNFGATMYRLATFRKLPTTVPETDMDIDPELWARQLKPVAECNAGAPKPLCDLIHRCLAFDAHKRPESMRDVRSALDKLGEEMAIEHSGPLEW